MNGKRMLTSDNNGAETNNSDQKVDREKLLKQIVDTPRKSSSGIHYYPGAGDYAPSTAISGRS